MLAKDLGQGLNLGYGCEVKGVCLANGTNPTELPVRKEEYIDFVRWNIDMVKQEISLLPPHVKSADFFAGVMGLSGGISSLRGF